MTTTRPESAIWHDVECGAYAADLALWEELAEEAEGPILDLGCGTGRVALHLARRGHRVTGLDADADLLAAFGERAEGLQAAATLGDAREFELGSEFGLVLAPMQLFQLLGSSDERTDCLRCGANHLRPGGRMAVAIIEGFEGEVMADEPPPLPDVREIDGWVYSSLPVEAFVDSSGITVRRLRQTVSPDGDLGDEIDEIRLWELSTDALEREAAAAGLKPAGHRAIPATDVHVGSVAVVLEKEA